MNYLTQNTLNSKELNTNMPVVNDYDSINPYAGLDTGTFIAVFGVIYVVIIAITIIDVVLKVKAMWRAARLSDKGWFISLFIFNTAGILPFIYLRNNKKRYQDLILKKHQD